MRWVVWRLLTHEGPYQYFVDFASVDRASWRQHRAAAYEECEVELDNMYNVTKCLVLRQY